MAVGGWAYRPVTPRGTRPRVSAGSASIRPKTGAAQSSTCSFSWTYGSRRTRNASMSMRGWPDVPTTTTVILWDADVVHVFAKAT